MAMINDAVVVSVSINTNDVDNALLIVGKKKMPNIMNSEIDVIKAVQGEEAMELYEKLWGIDEKAN